MWNVPRQFESGQFESGRLDASRIEHEAINDSELLVGHLSVPGPDWICRSTGGTDGISLGDPDGLLHLSVRGSGNETLPVAGEQYVKADEWKIDYPQVAGQFSLRLSIRVVEVSSERVVLEPTFSIQTSLLDTHPTLDLRAVGGAVSRSKVSVVPGDGEVSVTTMTFTGKNAPTGSKAGEVTVLLGPLDAPFTTDRSREDRIELELFGEFLEKGVIRKARPWVILDRSDDGISDEEISGYADALTQTPLPLTF